MHVSNTDDSIVVAVSVVKTETGEETGRERTKECSMGTGAASTCHEQYLKLALGSIENVGGNMT